MKITQIEVNIETGEEIVKEVELSQAEVAEMEKQQKVSQIQQRMGEIKQELAQGDWKTVKCLELGLVDEEHLAKRAKLRQEFNDLESQLKGL